VAAPDRPPVEDDVSGPDETPDPVVGEDMAKARSGPSRRERRVPAAHSGVGELHSHQHRDIRGGGARAAVFGMSDGLVTNVSLILGMAGAHPAATVVRLAGLAGLVAGSVSMASGEYVSMRAQAELLERELAVERRELRRSPEAERRELVKIYEDRGMEPGLARALAAEMMRTPELALETHAREELGIDPGDLGSPWQAAGSSFVTFAAGAVLPLLPWFFTRGTAAVLGSIVLGLLGAIVLGSALAAFTRRSWWWSALRQVGISAVAAGVTFAIGHLVGAGAVG
jgi:VIT1/CCC1 family predicted Fe2+/Mn2+ transporter